MARAAKMIHTDGFLESCLKNGEKSFLLLFVFLFLGRGGLSGVPQWLPFFWRFHWVLTTDDRMDLFRFFCEGLIKNSLSSRVNWNPDRWKWVWEWKLRQFWKTWWNLEEEGVWGLFLNITAMSQKFCYIYNRVQLRQENNKVKSRTIYDEKRLEKTI